MGPGVERAATVPPVTVSMFPANRLRTFADRHRRAGRRGVARPARQSSYAAADAWYRSSSPLQPSGLAIAS